MVPAAGFFFRWGVPLMIAQGLVEEVRRLLTQKRVSQAQDRPAGGDQPRHGGCDRPRQAPRAAAGVRRRPGAVRPAGALPGMRRAGPHALPALPPAEPAGEFAFATRVSRRPRPGAAGAGIARRAPGAYEEVHRQMLARRTRKSKCRSSSGSASLRSVGGRSVGPARSAGRPARWPLRAEPRKPVLHVAQVAYTESPYSLQSLAGR